MEGAEFSSVGIGNLTIWLLRSGGDLSISYKLPWRGIDTGNLLQW